MVCKYGGLIHYYKLDEWWDSLTEDNRQFIRNSFSKTLSNNTPDHLRKSIDDPSKSISNGGTASSFLTGMAIWVMSAHEYELANDMLNESKKRATSLTDLHFNYNQLIDLNYRRREEDPRWLEECIAHCKHDIEIFPDFREEYIAEEKKRLIFTAQYSMKINLEIGEGDEKQYKEDLQKAEKYTFDIWIPSFHRLAIIYEKQAKYDKAIKVCELALKYGLIDGTKAGFAGRIQKLKKKIT